VGEIGWKNSPVVFTPPTFHECRRGRAAGTWRAVGPGLPAAGPIAGGGNSSAPSGVGTFSTGGASRD